MSHGDVFGRPPCFVFGLPCESRYFPRVGNQFLLLAFSDIQAQNDIGIYSSLNLLRDQLAEHLSERPGLFTS